MAIAALFVVGGCGGTSPRRPPAPRQDAARSERPGIFCGRAALRGPDQRYRPAQIGCLTADGSEFLAGVGPGDKGPSRLIWTRWTPGEADGRGYLWHNACQPSCATGTFLAQPVSVRAVDPHNGWFTQLVVAFEGGPTAGPSAVAYTLELKLAQWVSKTPAPPGGRPVQPA
jgi:hypothetical protein